MRINRSIISNQTESVPTTRVLTIGGVSYDLTQDRTWVGGGTNIYTSDGTLTADRTLTHGTYNLTFVGSMHTNRFTANGRLLLGTISEGTQIFQVNGDSFLKGSGSTSGTTALTVQNSSGSNLIKILNNGRLVFGNSADPPFISSTGTASGSLLFYNAGSVNTDGSFIYRGDTAVATSGNNICLNISQSIGPSSGNGDFSLFSITSIINQTGTANGKTRGIYINPTLTSATDFRAIETVNGKVIFGNLPTSSAGLPTGAIWNDGGTLKIV